MLSSLKAIKMTGADRKAAATIQKLRSLEFEKSKALRRLLVGGLFSCKQTVETCFSRDTLYLKQFVAQRSRP